MTNWKSFALGLLSNIAFTLWFVALISCCLGGCHLQPKTYFRAVSPAAEQMLATPADRQECSSLDSKQLGWTVSAAAFGFLAGSGGGITAIVPDDTPKYAVGGVSLGLGLFTTVSSLLASAYTKKYAERCTKNTGGN